MQRRLQLLNTWLELLGSSPIPRSFVASCVSFQLRPLPSTGITRLRRYYEPLRHPKRPGLSLTSCQLILTAITAGASRVASGPLCLHAVANTPAGPMESVRSLLFPSTSAFPEFRAGRLLHYRFSRPAQRSLTLRPARSPSRLSDPLHRRLQQFRCLHRCSDCYRVERTSSRAGLPPAVDQRLSRRTEKYTTSSWTSSLLPLSRLRRRYCLTIPRNASTVRQRASNDDTS